MVARAKAEGVSVDEVIKRSESAEARAMMANRVPLGRNGTPEEVADLVFFLVSNQSSYITGDVIKIDGGAH